MQQEKNLTSSFKSMSLFSPAAFIIAFLGFFMTFTDINCNGTKLDSVSGFEFVKGYNSDLDDAGNETGTTDKYNPNLFLSIAFLIAITGIVFYFIKKMRKNYRLNSILAGIAFICMLAFMIDLKQKIASIDPDKNLTEDTYVDLDVEMKFGYWLVTACFLAAGAWNWTKGKQPAVGSEQEVKDPAQLI